VKTAKAPIKTKQITMHEIEPRIHTNS
jgi:hypothetical protein